ncbi:hypothetical protein IAU60_004422 [Kwoniella sp. DSM 27419]
MAASTRSELSDYTVRLANEAQQLQHDEVAASNWANGLTFEQFHELSLRDMKAVWGKDGKYLTWVLVRRDDPEGDFYAGCQTFRRNAFIKYKGSDEVQDGYVYGIASVVTPQKHLRKGYATRMLSLLHHHLSPGSFSPPPESWGVLEPLQADQAALLPKAIGSILWSDVGSTFYSRCEPVPGRPGWIVEDHRNQELVWKIVPPASGHGATDTNDGLDEGCEWIWPSSLADVARELSVAVKSDLKRTDTSERAAWVHDPSSEGTFQYVIEKEQLMHGQPVPARPYGLRIRSGQGQDDTIVLFSMGMKSIGPRLLITFQHNLAAAQVPSLLKALDIVGHQAGFTEGWIWDLQPDSEVVKAWQSQDGRDVQVGRRQEVKGHLVGAAWYGAEDEAGQLVDGQMWTWM